MTELEGMKGGGGGGSSFKGGSVHVWVRDRKVVCVDIVPGA